MNQNEETGDLDENTRIVIEAETLDGIAAVLGTETPELAQDAGDSEQLPSELLRVAETLEEIYRGLEAVTEADSRGKSRKKVREHANREDIDSNAFGHHLRVLEFHGLAIQDGNRWRVTDQD